VLFATNSGLADELPLSETYNNVAPFQYAFSKPKSEQENAPAMQYAIVFHLIIVTSRRRHSFPLSQKLFIS
jgi:hypothetical protein